MFSSAAIEVVIGLVFIYILYSLLVTIITELIATIFKQRGNILQKGLKRMLDDDPKEEKGNDKKKAEDTNNDKNANKDEDAKKEDVLLSTKFLDSAEIKYLGTKSRFPSYINPATFSRAMVSVLKKLNDAEDLFDKNLEKLKNKENKSDTEEIIYNFLLEADGNVEKFKSLMESWYNETMDRVIGWYKRRLKLITFGIAILVAFTFSVDTIGIAKKLTMESDSRMEIVKMASDYSSNTNKDADSTQQIDEDLKEIIKDIRKQESIISIDRPSITEICTGDFWSYVLGCILTAIALSLGAPFWFDLLDKLVKMRGSGNQEKIEKKKTSTNKYQEETESSLKS